MCISANFGANAQWVTSGAANPCHLYGKVRFALIVEMSLRSSRTPLCGQKRTYAPQQTASLFDHLVGRLQERLRDRRPSALAVLRLTTSSNLLASCTGRSPGLAPLRMRST